MEINQITSQTIIIDVTGMKCAGCVGAVERQLKQQTGVISASVNLATEIAIVACEIDAINPETLAAKLTDAGFPSQPRYADNNWREVRIAQQTRQRQEIRHSMTQLISSTILIVLSGIGHLGTWGIINFPLLNNIWFHCSLAIASLVFPGREIIIDGVRGLMRNAPNMNTLIALGATSSFGASFIALLFPQLGWECFFDEPVMLLAFIVLGKTLEKQARFQAASALQFLIELQPPTAKLVKQDQDITDSNYIEIPVDTVKVGECLQVLPGDQVPVDGMILMGKTTVNEAMITGESTPVMKQINDTLIAGTLNLSGAVILQATHTGSETTLAQIVGLVESAQTRKAPIQYFADIIAGYFTYGVMSIALLTFLFWNYLGVHIWPDVLHMASPNIIGMTHHLEMSELSPILLSLKLAIAVLVVACPCALGLATPTAILVGSGIGAEQGLLIKGGDVLEKLHQLDTIVFDKTGTLTTGAPEVTEYLSFSEKWDKNQILQMAATVESGTFHPLATAILNAAKQQDLPLLKATDFYTEPGLGVSAKIENNQVLVGNYEWLAGQGYKISNKPDDLPGTLIYIGIDGQLAGSIACKEMLRKDAQMTVSQLQKMGLQVIMLTGDSQNAARGIAKQLNIPLENVFAEVKPQAKVELIKSLQNRSSQSLDNAKGVKRSIVAMIGDGINDAPALAQSDVSMSLKVGTDVAIATSQIILMGDSLLDIVKSIALGRTTFNTIQQNLVWAFGYNFLGIPLAAGVLLPNWQIVLSPAIAGALMAFSSVSVVTNSLLLRQRLVKN